MKKLIGLFLISVVLVSCNNDPETTDRVKIKKNKTKLVEPRNNQKFSLGDELTLRVEAKKDTTVIDSLVLYFNNQKFTGKNAEVSISSSLTGVGTPRLILNVYLKGGLKETLYPKVRIFPEAPKQYSYRAVNAFPHDDDAYTQGLLISGGQLYEGTGKEGKSTLRKVDLSSGEVIQSVLLDNKYFGEGIAVVQDKIFQLTWRAQEVFVYNMNFEKQSTLSLDVQEGWGLTNMGDTLVTSDGTEYLYFRNPDFTQIKRMQVWDNNGRVMKLNELEYINGLIYANVYLTDRIVMVDPKSGAVVGDLDLAGLYTGRNVNDPDYVLNGIAYDSNTGKIYVTGKYWPSLYEIDVIETNPKI